MIMYACTSMPRCPQSSFSSSNSPMSTSFTAPDKSASFKNVHVFPSGLYVLLAPTATPVPSRQTLV